MKRNAFKTLAGSLLILALMGTPSAYALIEIPWYTVDGGGVSDAAGSGFQLSATIGQADASLIMAGADFELAGGYWASSYAGCFGDLDNDGEVGLSDLATLLSNYGAPAGMTYADGDLDGDGDVDLSDLAALLAVYGDICA